MANEVNLRDLFERGVDVAKEDCEPLLSVECEHDPDLYAELISLLTADTNALRRRLEPIRSGQKIKHSARMAAMSVRR